MYSILLPPGMEIKSSEDRVWIPISQHTTQGWGEILCHTAKVFFASDHFASSFKGGKAASVSLTGRRQGGLGSRCRGS